MTSRAPGSRAREPVSSSRTSIPGRARARSSAPGGEADAARGARALEVRGGVAVWHRPHAARGAIASGPAGQRGSSRTTSAAVAPFWGVDRRRPVRPEQRVVDVAGQHHLDVRQGRVHPAEVDPCHPFERAAVRAAARRPRRPARGHRGPRASPPRRPCWRFRRRRCTIAGAARLERGADDLAQPGVDAVSGEPAPRAAGPVRRRPASSTAASSPRRAYAVSHRLAGGAATRREPACSPPRAPRPASRRRRRRRAPPTTSTSGTASGQSGGHAARRPRRRGASP